jgi:hypothetical protein
VCTLSAADTAFFNVLDYGAKRDASAPSTAAFRAAIQAASKAGGGTVFVPAGQYTSGAIELVSNTNFHVDAGATIRFLADRSLYPMVASRFEGVETRAPEAMIGAHNAENIAITGRGTLAADNAEWRKLVGSDPAWRAAWTNMLGLIERKQPVPEDLRRTGEMSLRTDFIRTVESLERSDRRYPHQGLAYVGPASAVLRERSHPQCRRGNLPRSQHRRRGRG